MRSVGGPTSTNPHDLSWDLAHANGEAVVVLAGELDLATAPVLADVMDGLHGSSARTVVFDVAGLEFCDSSGLSMLVRSHRAAEERGVRIVLRSPRPAMQSLLEITKLEYLIEPGRPDRRPPEDAAGRPGWSA